jgi:predicted patatin/cPLA2 family phospholipase
MAARRRVFILGGGASLGAHHVGAMRYLEEQGIRPDAIIGSSIGTINACLYASGGLERMSEGWSEFSSLRHIVDLSFRHNLLTGFSLFSQEKLARQIERYVDYRVVFANPVETAFVLLNLSKGAGEILTSRDADSPEELKKIARAGYAIPFLFPPARVRGDMCVDGGFAWNIPLEQAMRMKATEIYVLTVIPHKLPYHKRFRTIVDFSARFVDVMWRTLGNVGYLYAPIEDGKFAGIPVTLIEPGEELSGLPMLDIFNVHPKKSRRLMQLGYRDAKRTFARGRPATKRAAAHARQAASEQASIKPSRVPARGHRATSAADKTA